MTSTNDQVERANAAAEREEEEIEAAPAPDHRQPAPRLGRPRRRRAAADAAATVDAAVPPEEVSDGREAGADQPAAPLTLGGLARSVLQKEYASLRTHQAGVQAGDDPEAVHDMRVALRRLRAALSLFRNALPASLQPFRTEFAWIAASLGAVRDLDVLIEQVWALAPELTAAASPGLSTIIGWLEEERTASRVQLLAALDSPRYQDALAGFAATLTMEDAPVGPLAEEPVLLAAPALVERRYRQLRQAGDGLTTRSPAGDYHQLRIRGKRLRYALDFFTDVYGRAVRPLRRRLADLQGLLGDHQDVEVARTRLRELRRARQGEISGPERAPLKELRRHFKGRGPALRREFRAAYREVKTKQWKRLKVVLEVRRARAARLANGSLEE